MNSRILAIFAALSICAFAGCSEPVNDIPDWPWVDPVPAGPTDPTDPADPTDPTDPADPVDPDPEGFVGKPRYVWIDASANFRFFANDRDRIASDLALIKSTGFTDVVVDVRPTEGTVLYDSKVAPHASRFAAWVDGYYKFVNRREEFDYLQAFVEEGHKLGLRVNAAINTFVGGYRCPYGLGDEGLVFEEPAKKAWATVYNSLDGQITELDMDTYGTVFLNPCNDDVQDYVLSILAEIAAYDVDGIILDRCRFGDGGLMCDFSEITKSKFEAYYGGAVKNWPSDIFSKGATDLPSRPSDIQKTWLEFRAKTIHDFIVEASDKVHSVNPDVRFGVYVGAWYSSYYTSGVNWASPSYNTSAHYNWASKNYSEYGFADHCDFMLLGCYAGTSSVYGRTEWTMQGFAKLGKQIIGDACEVSGGPDVGNGTGFENGGQSDIIPKTVDACINACDGYFCFDLCHIRMYDYWDAFKKGIDDYLKTVK